MKVIKADNSHIAALGRILHQVNDIHADARPDIFIHGQRKYTDSELKDLLADPARPVFVAEEGGEVLGYAFCVIENTERHNLRAEKTLFIDDICVDETRRGNGIGKALYDYVNQYAREIGCRRITLNVWSFDTGATEFYKKMGMHPLKTVMEQIL